MAAILAQILNPKVLQRSTGLVRGGGKSDSVKAVQARRRPQPEISVCRLQNFENSRLGKALLELPFAQVRLGERAVRVERPCRDATEQDNRRNNRSRDACTAKFASQADARQAETVSWNFDPHGTDCRVSIGNHSSPAASSIVHSCTDKDPTSRRRRDWNLPRWR